MTLTIALIIITFIFGIAWYLAKIELNDGPDIF